MLAEGGSQAAQSLSSALLRVGNLADPGSGLLPGQALICSWLLLLGCSSPPTLCLQAWQRPEVCRMHLQAQKQP